jgi:aspartyl-tRNA(Asn)/glutamyl-tRNA(Gln) amidotransferase subunit C
VEVTKEDVARIAQLSRLRIGEDEAVRIAGELSRILDHVQLLQEVELSGTDEDVRPSEGPLPFRDPGLPADALASGAPGSQAPDWQDGFFAVPRLSALDSTSGPGRGDDEEPAG